jgi:hypothetical protein
MSETVEPVFASTVRADRLRDKTLRISYNYCGICGHTPSRNEQPNYAPLRWWDADDGWKIGTLCSFCHDEVFNDRPKEGDFAFKRTNEVCDSENTDEDPALAL